MISKMKNLCSTYGRTQINPQSTKIPRAKKCTLKNLEKRSYLVLAGVTKRCRLYWLTNTVAPSYMSPNAGGGGVAGSQPMSTAVHMEPKLTSDDLRTYPGVSLKEAASILDRSLLLRLRLVRFFRPAIS